MTSNTLVFLLVCLSTLCSSLLAQGHSSRGEISWLGRSSSLRQSGFVSAWVGSEARWVSCTRGSWPREQKWATCGPCGQPLEGSSRRPRRKSVALPSMGLNPDTVYTANEWIAGVAGGSVGVLGTLIQLELKQERVKSRRNCPYCNGSGKLICGECCSSGKVLVKLPGESSPMMITCPTCGGEKYVTCMHCGGDGRAVPRALDKKDLAASDIDISLEEIGMSDIAQSAVPSTQQA